MAKYCIIAVAITSILTCVFFCLLLFLSHVRRHASGAGEHERRSVCHTRHEGGAQSWTKWVHTLTQKHTFMVTRWVSVTVLHTTEVIFKNLFTTQLVCVSITWYVIEAGFSPLEIVVIEGFVFRKVAFPFVCHVMHVTKMYFHFSFAKHCFV